MMWIMNPASEGADTRGRGDSSGAREMKCSWLGHEEAERRRGRDEYEYDRRGRQGDYGRPGYTIRNDMRAAELMSRNVVTVYPEDRVGYAARLMRDNDCGALPVIDQEGRLIGIVTDRDISMRLVANEADTHNTVVADCMTDGAFACHAEDSVRECMPARCRAIGFGGCPSPTTDWGQVLGIVSQGDLARHAGNYPGRGERRALADVVCAVSEPRRAARR